MLGFRTSPSVAVPGSVEMVPPAGVVNGRYHAGATCYVATHPASTPVNPEHVDALKAQGWLTKAEFERLLTASVPPPPPKPVQHETSISLTPGEPLVRLLPPVHAQGGAVKAWGRTYQVPTLKPQDLPATDARVLIANGWTAVGTVGTPTNRPARVARGDHRFEGGRELVWDGTTWRDQATGETA